MSKQKTVNDIKIKDGYKEMRQEFADTMLEVGKEDPDLVVLIADISHFILQPFSKACPGRFYNIGICEPTVVNMAAGLSKVGFFPVIHTITPFLIERSFEQFKLDFGYQRLGGNVVAVGSAFDYSSLGVTHHCYGDFALMKTIENSSIFYPATPAEFNILFKQVYRNGGLNYFRIPKQQHMLDIPQEKIRAGQGIRIKEGNDITIIATGPQLETAVDSVTILQKNRTDPEIIYIHTIKPLDTALIRESLKKTGKCLVIEEHGKYGGLFDDVLRETADMKNIQYASLNIGNKFIHNYGTYRDICNSLGLSMEGVKNIFRI